MTIRKLTIEDLARAVLFDDAFNNDVMMLDMMHVFEIALKKSIGFNCLIDGALDIDLDNGYVLRCKLAPKDSEVTDISKMLALCDLTHPHLMEGQRLFASKSIVVGVNDSQPLQDRLTDIEITIGQLQALHQSLSEKESKL
jgi:hypothetical protein